MKLSCTLLALLLLIPAAASAQPPDLAGDLTGYTRFVVYPHLQRGWESMQRGERDRALAEFEQARALAPENAGVALQLAAAYRTFGEPARAESVLRQQLTRTPNDRRLQTAIADLQQAAPAAPAQASRVPSPALSPTPTAPRASDAAPSTGRSRRRVGRPACCRRLVSRSQAATAPVQADPSTELRRSFVVALETRRFEDAERDAKAMLAAEAAGAGLLDELTYKLVEAGAGNEAARTLLRAYPFASGTRRRTRHAAAAADHADCRAAHACWTMSNCGRCANRWIHPRCAAVRPRCGRTCSNARSRARCLSDMSPEYGHDDWMRLGDCSTIDDPALALAGVRQGADTATRWARGARARLPGACREVLSDGACRLAQRRRGRIVGRRTARGGDDGAGGGREGTGRELAAQLHGTRRHP